MNGLQTTLMRVCMGLAAAVLVLGVFGAASPAYAAECAACHAPGGIAPDGSAHPVPPFATVSGWDPRDGQCTICHEVPNDVLSGYQSPPHGPVPASLAADGDHYWIIDTHCDECHGGVHGVLKAAPVYSMPDNSLINIAGSDCAGCHTTGMAEGEAYPASAVPQVEASHGDVELAHAPAVSGYCLDCHQADLSARHPDCLTCHALGTPAGETCVSCHPGYDSGHGYILLTGALFNPSAAGYLSWDRAKVLDPINNVGSPHGGYTANTNKCAVCHSVHQAAPAGSVLTAYGPYGTLAEGCVSCHGQGTTFTDVTMVANADGYISPHGTCTRCHVSSPHAAGGSVYPVLAQKLLNTRGDAHIDADLAATKNDVVLADFNEGSVKGLILGTGYLCSGCHYQAFAVNTPGNTPGTIALTGHRVLALATDTWTPADYGAAGAYTTPNDDMTIAYADAYGCDGCHAAQATGAGSAFPHGYVNAAGEVQGKTTAGASYIWLTYGSYAGSTDTTILPTAGDGSSATPANLGTELLTRDGLCLKCHRHGSGEGVGQSY